MSSNNRYAILETVIKQLVCYSRNSNQTTIMLETVLKQPLCYAILETNQTTIRAHYTHI